MTHALYLARRALADGGDAMPVLVGGGGGDSWGGGAPAETAFAESYGAPVGFPGMDAPIGPYGNPTPGPIAVEASPLGPVGSFNPGSGDTSGAATPGSGRGPSSYSGPAPSLTGMDNLPSEILNGSTDYNGISQPGYNSSLGSISSTPLGPPDLGSNAPVTSGPFGWAGHSAPYGSGPAGMATLGPVSSGVQNTPAYDQMGNPMGFSTSNNFMDGRGYGQAPQASREAGILGSPFGSKISDYNYGTPFSLNESFSQPNKGYSYGDKPVNPGFGGMSNAADSWSGGFDYSHLDGMDFDVSPGSVFGAELGSSSAPRGSSYNGAFAGQPFDMQGNYGTGGKNSTGAVSVGQYGAPVTTGMTPGFAAPSKGVALGDKLLGDWSSVAPISVSPAIPTGFYDPMTGFSANLSGWGGGGGGGDYAGGGFGGGAPGLGGGVMGGDPAMGGGDRGMNRGGQVRRPFAEGGAPQPTERRQEEARPYEPTIRDRLASWMMGDAERASPARRSMVEGLTGSTGLGTTGMGLVDVTPAGIPMAVQEARRDAQGGDWLGATMNATAVLPGAKVVTEPVKDALQGASRYIRAYHGSPKTDLTTLLPSKRGPLGPGTYMTPAPNVASRYAGDTGKVYEKNLNADEIFGATRMLNRSDINPYEVWRDQFGRVVEAAPSEIRGDIAKMAEKFDPSDGYPFYNQLARLSGGDDKAQELLRAAKFKGIAGYVDGPEISLFDPQQLAIRAYHGSPHNFDRFSLSKIGTGEGAQAYGHGLYFAENEGVARGYRDDLSPRSTRYFHGDKMLDGAEENAADLIRNSNNSREEALKYLNEELRLSSFADPEFLRETQAALMRLDPKRVEMRDIGPQGHMYEVAIKADPEHFLDWDKPLREQGAVGDAARLIAERNLGDMARFAETGGNVMRKIGYGSGGPDDATTMLREAGIPGIKYLDAGSRTAGDGSRNYVVFDDNLIDILRKYGIGAGAVGAGGAMAVQNPQGDQ